MTRISRRSTGSGASRRSLYGLLTASVVSVAGTRVSAIALPWFVLTTTGSAAQTGLVVLFELTPYVLVKALGGPLIDRRGPRVVSLTADVASAVVAGCIPLLYATGQLTLPVLLVLVALLGCARGPGDAAKSALVPAVADAAGLPLERVTGLEGTANRTASIVAPGLAGVLIAAIGPASAVLADALSFAVAAVLIGATAPRHTPPHEEVSEAAYLHRLRQGWDFLRREPLLRAAMAMVAVTNWLDAAYSTVLLPVWVRDHGFGPELIGLLGSTFGLTATLGSLLATAWWARLPRRLTYLVGFTLCGAPRFVALAMGAPVAVLVGVGVVGGFGAGFINPVLGAIMLERIPRHLVGRVGSLSDAVCWVGIPLGGVSAGAAIALVGLAPALAVAGGLYFVTTLLPGLRPEWREMDRRRVSGTPHEPVLAAAGPGAAAAAPPPPA